MTEPEHITYQQLKQMLCDHNDTENIEYKGQDENPLIGVVVFKADNWTEEYSLESRSYKVTSNNKAFIRSNAGYSIFANNLSGDDFARLDRYMAEEDGGPGGWRVDYCYIQGVSA